ncbi:hypothetical protein [Thioalkalivibrio sp. ALE19]|uniref:hypothetical protein n=1 Tax=Thioalkalivibrio sp. ALE19 TaxID=1266909 RepID=UPI0003F79B9E|nr:hypothetical protein [Thioalkalivibrio sp. ALE19]
MYLADLSFDEKKIFLGLAHVIARTNGVYEETEKEVLVQFEKEMSLDEDLDEVVREFEGSDIESCLSSVESLQSRRIIFMEALILVYANDHFDDAQKEIVDRMCDACRIDRRLYSLMAEWAQNMLSLNRQGRALIEI